MKHLKRLLLDLTFVVFIFVKYLIEPESYKFKLLYKLVFNMVLKQKDL